MCMFYQLNLVFTITQDSGSELSQDDVDNIIYKDEGSNHGDVKNV